MTNEKLKLALEQKKIRDAHLTEEERIQLSIHRMRLLESSLKDMGLLAELVNNLKHQGIIK